MFATTQYPPTVWLFYFLISPKRPRTCVSRLWKNRTENASSAHTVFVGLLLAGGTRWFPAEQCRTGTSRGGVLGWKRKTKEKPTQIHHTRVVYVVIARVRRRDVCVRIRKRVRMSRGGGGTRSTCAGNVFRRSLTRSLAFRADRYVCAHNRIVAGMTYKGMRGLRSSLLFFWFIRNHLAAYTMSLHAKPSLLALLWRGSPSLRPALRVKSFSSNFAIEYCYSVIVAIQRMSVSPTRQKYNASNRRIYNPILGFLDELAFK